MNKKLDKYNANLMFIFVINKPSGQLINFLTEKSANYMVIKEYTDVLDLIKKTIAAMPESVILDQGVLEPTDIETFSQEMYSYGVSVFLNIKANKPLLFEITAPDVEVKETPVFFDAILERHQKEKDKKLSVVKSMQPLATVSNEFIGVPGITKIDIIKIEEILYIEASGRYSILHLNNGKNYTASKNIGAYNTLFKNNTFYRIHHKYLVNLSQVSYFDRGSNSCTLINKVVLPVSKRRKPDLSFYLN